MFVPAGTDRTVCASGCHHADLQSAWEYFSSRTLLGPVSITLQGCDAHPLELTRTQIFNGFSSHFVHIVGPSDSTCEVRSAAHTGGSHKDATIVVRGGARVAMRGFTLAAASSGNSPSGPGTGIEVWDQSQLVLGGTTGTVATRPDGWGDDIGEGGTVTTSLGEFGTMKSATWRESPSISESDITSTDYMSAFAAVASSTIPPPARITLKGFRLGVGAARQGLVRGAALAVWCDNTFACVHAGVPRRKGDWCRQPVVHHPSASSILVSDTLSVIQITGLQVINPRTDPTVYLPRLPPAAVSSRRSGLIVADGSTIGAPVGAISSENGQITCDKCTVCEHECGVHKAACVCFQTRFASLGKHSWARLLCP